MASAEKITDHKKIKAWAEARGGRPSVVRSTHDEGHAGGKGAKGKRGGGILRFDFQEPDDALEEISWEEFFEIFEENDLALLEQEKTADGHDSRFFKFVAR